jgi:hypothetical protein
LGYLGAFLGAFRTLQIAELAKYFVREKDVLNGSCRE